MNLVKKQSAGNILALVVALLSLVGVVVYFININGEGYFGKASVTNLVLFAVLAALALVVAVVLSNLKVSGAAATVVKLIVGACQIVAPALLALCLVDLVAARAEGLGFIYFSNADVILEVQTPENLTSATWTIVNMVCLGVSTIAAMVSAFFTLKTKEN